VAGYLAVATVAGLLLAPIMPAMLTRAYRLRSGPAPDTRSDAVLA